MTAEALAAALGARRCGSGWVVRCPAHEDKTPSLAIREGRDGRALVKCHAGCDQDDVISALRALGLWPRRLGLRVATKPRNYRRAISEDTKHLAKVALTIWKKTTPAVGTIAETYLRSRGITIQIPGELRFAGALKHPCGEFLPAIVASVTNAVSGERTAIHRTFLDPNGLGKASVDPVKMMLGPCAGGVVQLAAFGEPLMIGEGVETCLAAMQATGLPAWAALSASGLSSLDLPIFAREILILADGDDPGERAARTAALRWAREGRHVRIARPPTGLDFNDLLVADVPEDEDVR